MKTRTEIQPERCPTCNQIISEREIALYRGIINALWRVFRWCEQKNIHEFKRKDIKHLFINENDTARFGDLVMFGGLIYKDKKASYGLNMERCDQFFSSRYAIPIRIWKNPITGELRKEDWRYINQIPEITKLLNEDEEYRVRYREPATEPKVKQFLSATRPGLEHQAVTHENGNVTCECESYQYRKTCKHVREMIEQNVSSSMNKLI